MPQGASTRDIFWDGGSYFLRCPLPAAFLGVDYEELARRVLQGGSDEDILDWCYARRGRKPTEEELLIWNSFLAKRGWRDESSADLQAAKERLGWGERGDIQTWVDLHDAEEGRQPRS